MSAKVHGIEEMAVPLKKATEQMGIEDELDFSFVSQAIIPPQPLIFDREKSNSVDANWPHNLIEQEDILNTKFIGEEEEKEIENTDLDLGLTLDDQMPEKEQEDQGKAMIDIDDVDDDAWGNSDSEELDDFEDAEEEKVTESEEKVILADDIPGMNSF